VGSRVGSQRGNLAVTRAVSRRAPLQVVRLRNHLQNRPPSRLENLPLFLPHNRLEFLRVSLLVSLAQLQQRNQVVSQHHSRVVNQRHCPRLCLQGSPAASRQDSRLVTHLVNPAVLPPDNPLEFRLVNHLASRRVSRLLPLRLYQPGSHPASRQVLLQRSRRVFPLVNQLVYRQVNLLALRVPSRQRNHLVNHRRDQAANLRLYQLASLAGHLVHLRVVNLLRNRLGVHQESHPASRRGNRAVLRIRRRLLVHLAALLLNPPVSLRDNPRQPRLLHLVSRPISRLASRRINHHVAPVVNRVATPHLPRRLHPLSRQAVPR